MTSRHFAQVNGIRLRYLQSGDGPPVVLLHGFPEFSYTWRRQLPALSAAGVRCIAPDLRGYNESDKPARVRDYAIGELVRDIAELIQQVAGEPAYVVGHDWGGSIAWHLAARKPDLVRKLIIINSPHPAIFRRALRRGPQLLRSWYALFFQLPALPELVLSSFHFRLLTRGGARSREDRERYEDALSQPGALTAALNYYRAMGRSMLARNPERAPVHVTVPTLVLWGERDEFLRPDLLDGLGRFVSNLEVVRFAEGRHWLHIDAADCVNEEIVRFLNAL